MKEPRYFVRSISQFTITIAIATGFGRARGLAIFELNQENSNDQHSIHRQSTAGTRSGLQAEGGRDANAETETTKG
jgi:predicted Fe-Mo cluster-binding NifX family protein